MNYDKVLLENFNYIEILLLRVLMNPHNLKFTGKIQVYKRTYDVFKKLFQGLKIKKKIKMHIKRLIIITIIIFTKKLIHDVPKVLLLLFSTV